MISAKTKLYGILGDPIEHSLSPAIQNAALQATGIEAVYLAFRVKKERLKEAVAGIRSLDVKGVNVTIPHKVDIIKYLDRVDPLAEQIGAVNTVKNEDGELTGYNTDGLGAIKALKEAAQNLAHKRVILVGAGGAAKAISYTLANEGANLTILNRNLLRAKTLAEEIEAKTGRTIDYLDLHPDNLEKTLTNAEILVNATSVGMTPKSKETPVDKKFLHPKLVVFDIVYNPLETRLLREAREKGARVVDGLGMLIYQGAEAFEIWTKQKAPVEVMRSAALTELKVQKT